jgi:microcystin-dependent protein
MEPFIGEIRMFAGNYAPIDWAMCDGSLLPIGRYQELFSLIQTFYGGDGMSNFAVPDLRGRAPIHAGQSTAAGSTNYYLGQQAGTENVTLSQQQMPAHNHLVNAVSSPANQVLPTNFYPAAIIDEVLGTPTNSFSDAAADVTMKTDTLTTVGGNQPFGIVQPVLAVNFIIALRGIWPSRP